jgi:cohesin complex subunit SA-1/2
MSTAVATPNGTQEDSRRKSGRTVRRPDIFAEADHQGSIVSNGSAKRKRTPLSRNATSGENEDEADSEEESEEDESESEPDEEEMKERRRVQRKKTGTTKPATKRAKTANGASTTLTIRSANVPGRPATKGTKTQKARARPSQVNKEGLFAEVFGRGQSGDAAAATWMSSLRKDSVAAIRDLVNFVFECIGCEQKIQSSDIEDIDNVTNKLGDVLEEYAHNKAAEYPLISKARQYAEFRTVLVDFFSATIKRLHSDSILYDQPEIFDNINVWVATMSGASYRPFRHTATVICLSIATALCEIAREIQESMATTKTQLDAEKKKKSVNKGRVSIMQEGMKADEKKLETVDAYLRDLFDTVYVHRYRDVEEKIRVECVAALGSWIVLYRKMFLEGQYLRYLGWIMSDPNSPTRLEVVRQLKTLFKQQRNIPALRAFTDRFRSRMVEMGARDADISVRAESIELLDRLRNAELLEPDDIDTIGRLIFDTEARVRRAVAKFFVSNIEDLYKLSTEDFDQDEYSSALPELDESGDSMSPNQAWIKFKCLAQTLGSYDKDSASDHADDHHVSLRNEDSDTRYMLATQAIFSHMPELNSWESLAGYLLYDHSSITTSPDDADVNLAVKGAYKLVTGEETILLDILYFSVKMYLASIVELQNQKKGGRTNASKDEVRKKQETAAHNLSTIIPQLLSRYGSTPQAATSILRLEQLLDVDLISDLQAGEGGSSYSALLEDINKQFVTHSDRKVLAEASKALRMARGYEQSKEAADAKVRELWDDANATLFGLLKGKNIETRGTLERTMLRQVVDTCVRCANLASVGDCAEVLEAKHTTRKGKGKATGPESLFDLMVALVHRGVPDEETTEAFAEMEDQLCVAVVTVLSFYFRWKVVGLKNAIEKNEMSVLSPNFLVGLSVKKESFVEAITPVISGRLPLDPVRVQSLLATMDLFTLFATVKTMRPTKGEIDEDVKVNLQGLTATCEETLWNEVFTTLERMEKALAKKTGRKIDTAADKDKKKNGRKDTVEHEEETQEEIEKPPEDSDDEDALDSDDDESADDGAEEVEGRGREAKKQAALLAEQALCELASKIVLAVIAGVVPDRESAKARLQINRTKLGKSYGQVVAYLDEKKEKGKKKAAGAGHGPVTPSKKGKERVVVRSEPEPMEVEGDEIEDEVEEVDGGDEDDVDDERDDREVDEDAVGRNDNVQGHGVDDEIMGD